MAHVESIQKGRLTFCLIDIAEILILPFKVQIYCNVEYEEGVARVEIDLLL